MDLLDLQTIIDRLAAIDRATPDGPGYFREVGGLADLGALMKQGRLRASPSAFVVPATGQAGRTREGSGPLRQDIAQTIAVVIGVNLSGALGREGLTKLVEPIGKVRASLFAWAHPRALYKFECGDEGLEDFNADTGVTLYRMDFLTAVRLVETTS